VALAPGTPVGAYEIGPPLGELFYIAGRTSLVRDRVETGQTCSFGTAAALFDIRGIATASPVQEVTSWLAPSCRVPD